jgi:preprotein translocase subunit SecG
MITFLLVLHAIIAAALVTVILMQRSEGGGLGMGGSPSGLMSARGAADFLTRATAVLASLFVGFSILLAVLASTRGVQTVDPSLATGRPQPSALTPPPTGADDGALTGAARQAAQGSAVAGNAAAPAGNSAVPLAR